MADEHDSSKLILTSLNTLMASMKYSISPLGHVFMTNATHLLILKIDQQNILILKIDQPNILILKIFHQNILILNIDQENILILKIDQENILILKIDQQNIIIKIDQQNITHVSFFTLLNGKVVLKFNFYL